MAEDSSPLGGNEESFYAYFPAVSLLLHPLAQFYKVQNRIRELASGVADTASESAKINTDTGALKFPLA